MNNLENINESLFENIKHINEYGQEYWIARELIQVLGYNEYRFFKKVILKAIDACKASNNEVPTISCRCTEWLISAAGRNVLWRIIIYPDTHVI